jgi:hypothetical protein
MKPWKTPGMNGLPKEAFKYQGETNMEFLHQAIVLYWTDLTMDADDFHQVTQTSTKER